MFSIVHKDHNKTKVIAAQRSLDEAHVNAEEQLDLNQAAVESEVPKLRQETSGPKRTRLDQNLPLRNFARAREPLLGIRFYYLCVPYSSIPALRYCRSNGQLRNLRGCRGGGESKAFERQQRGGLTAFIDMLVTGPEAYRKIPRVFNSAVHFPSFNSYKR